MSYTPPGQEPQRPQPQQPQPQQPSYSTPQYDGGQNGYTAPAYDAGQSGYAAPAYDAGQTAYAGYAASPAPKSEKKTFGLWALILGISGIVLPLFLNSLAGVGLGIAGLLRENSKGMSIAGIVTGGVGFIWGFIFWFGVVPLIALAALASYGYNF